MKLTRLVPIALLAITLFTGCKKDKGDDIGEMATASKMTGKVLLQDRWGGITYDDRAGTNVILGGQYVNHQAFTDNSGRYEFADKESGTYSLTISRENYGAMSLPSIDFSINSPNYPVNGDYQTLPTVTLGRPSNSYFDSTMVQVIYNTEILYIDTFQDPWITSLDTTSADILFSARIYPNSPVPNGQYAYRMFLGKAPSTSSSSYWAMRYGTTPAATGEIDVLWTQSEWQQMGYEMGDDIYVRIYGDALNNISYSSPNGQAVYPNLSDSTGFAFGNIAIFN